jgi:tripartite-type tricarboxylate transporter receptor subunit TctC
MAAHDNKTETSMKRLAQAGIAAILATAALAGPIVAHADDYPSRPIHIVVPAVPGGGTDFTARYVAQRLTQALGQSVVVDNRAGADGNIGVEYVAKSAPDGYTLVVPITSFPINPSVYKKLPFDTVKDFTAVALLSKAPQLLTINNQLPVHTVAELIAYAKAHPHTLNFGHSGNGTTANLAGQMFMKMTGTDMVPIGYKGGGQIITDLIAGHVQLYFSTVPSAIQQVKAGNLRGLAVSTPEPMPGLDFPTIAQTVPGFDVVGWFGLFAPAGTPKPIVDRINAEVVKIMAMPETKKAFANEGLLVGGGSPQDLQNFLASEMARWAKVIKDAGIQPE